MQFKDRLKELRTASHLTQKELAENIGLSTITIRSYESGRRIPNSDALIKLEKYFNVSGAYLRGETDQRIPMNRWEDSEIINSIDESIAIMLSNISKLIVKEREPVRDMYYVLLVEIQRLFQYDEEIQSFMVDSITHCAYAISRLTDTALSIKEDAMEDDSRYYSILEKETNKINESLGSIISYINYD